MNLLLGYRRALLTQVAQTAVRIRQHTVEQQVCRMILLSLDRVHGNSLQMTQEFLAVKLGVRRESVTAAALAIRRAGLSCRKALNSNLGEVDTQTLLARRHL